MNFNNSFQISASALTAQRLRMDVIAANIANADTSRSELIDGNWSPYRRKMVVMEPNGQQPSFEQVFKSKLNRSEPVSGVKVTRIVEDGTPFQRVYDPTHPDADENGFLFMPNVEPLKEMVDMISATRAYEANVTALNAAKSMFMASLEIGRR